MISSEQIKISLNLNNSLVCVYNLQVYNMIWNWWTLYVWQKYCIKCHNKLRLAMYGHFQSDWLRTWFASIPSKSGSVILLIDLQWTNDVIMSSTRHLLPSDTAFKRQTQFCNFPSFNLVQTSQIHRNFLTFKIVNFGKPVPNLIYTYFILVACLTKQQIDLYFCNFLNLLNLLIYKGKIWLFLLFII